MKTLQITGYSVIVIFKDVIVLCSAAPQAKSFDASKTSVKFGNVPREAWLHTKVTVLPLALRTITQPCALNITYGSSKMFSFCLQ